MPGPGRSKQRIKRIICKRKHYSWLIRTAIARKQLPLLQLKLDAPVQWVETAQDIFHSFCHRLHDFALVVIDVDPGSHGMALLEAISACGDRPPMIVLTSLEKIYMAPIAQKHGAAACLGKPIVPDELAKILNETLAKQCLTCDSWGHLTPPHIDEGRGVKAAVRGIAKKLSPIVKPSDGSGERAAVTWQSRSRPALPKK